MASDAGGSSDAPVQGPDDGGTDAVLKDGSSPSSAYVAAVLADKPRAYWRMHLESGGTTVRDEVGQNDLTLHAGFTPAAAGALVTGDDGAVEFDGVSGYGQATSSRDLDFAGNVSFSLEVWAKRVTVDSASGIRPFLSNTYFANNGYSMYAYADGTGSEGTYAELHPSPGTMWSTQLVAPGKWAHYAFTFDGALGTLAIDGAVVVTKSFTANMTTRTSDFQVARSANQFYFGGTIDEVAVYDHVLTADRIKAHIQAAR